ncbi:signal peptidase II [Candidatus Woesearchaeota archaeon]|jgi:signal peptidase II|nr:signal peptidase II [Candidatus Woesearchaeota archaeon]
MKVASKFLLIAFFIVILDQITKIIFKGVDNGILNYTENTGAAFGLFKGNVFILSIISVFVILLLLHYFIKYPKLYLPLAFLLGGATGNLIDRVFLGFVRDFIDLKVWPIFNVADSFNVIGVAIIGWILVTDKGKHL